MLENAESWGIPKNVWEQHKLCAIGIGSSSFFWSKNHQVNRYPTRRESSGEILHFCRWLRKEWGAGIWEDYRLWCSSSFSDSFKRRGREIMLHEDFGWGKLCTTFTSIITNYMEIHYITYQQGTSALKMWPAWKIKIFRETLDVIFHKWVCIKRWCCRVFNIFHLLRSVTNI